MSLYIEEPFVKLDEIIIRWMQWGVRQIELFMGVRVHALLKGLIFIYAIALIAFCAGFFTLFLFLHLPYLLVIHILVATFFISRIILLQSTINNWLFLPVFYTLITGRREKRLITLTLLGSILGVLSTYWYLSRIVPDLFTDWCMAVSALFVLYLAVEYTLCTDTVPMDERLRRQRRRKKLKQKVQGKRKR